MDYVHTPVLKREVLQLLSLPKDIPTLLIDCTLGEGGHSEAFLETYPLLQVIGLDRDANIMQKAIHRLSHFGSRFTAVNTWFNDFLETYDGVRPDAILFDLGISVFHYESSGRGFSFSKDEPLDMRLDDSRGESVADLVNTLDERAIADIIFKYGEERYGKRIASAIVQARDEDPITSSAKLADIISAAVPAVYRRGRIHPATRTFQAFRIAANGELDRIEPALTQAIELAKPGGKIGVISFHSLEDRIVKWLFKRAANGCTCPPEAPLCTCAGKPSIRILTAKPIVASEKENQINPPSRSAKLRVIEKLGE